MHLTPLTSGFEDHHLFSGHLLHRVRNAADSIAGFMSAAKGHPIASKRGVIVYEHCGGIKALCRVECRTDKDMRLVSDRMPAALLSSRLQP